MVADATLLGAPDAVVLDAVALEYPQRPVIHADGHGHGNFAVGRLEQLPDFPGEAEEVGGPVERPVHVLEEVHVRSHAHLGVCLVLVRAQA